MNELCKTLSEALNLSVEYVEKYAYELGEQIIVHEMITYWVVTIALLLLTVFCVYVSIRLYKGEKQRISPDYCGTFFMIIATIICCAAFLGNTVHLSQLYFTPEVELLKYLKTII